MMRTYYPIEEQRQDNAVLAFALLRSIKKGSILHYYNQTHQNEYVGRVLERISERTENNVYYTTFRVQVLNEDGSDREGFTDTAFPYHIRELVKI